ncbi:PTS sugar transporter subunit IIA [Anoxybacillus suryakundensis]|uniref:PTS system, fructose subfamily, IIA component n=1 Tax=Anoxybacillus suryakundensis TaxID=1325335 RepID=A0A0K6GPZ4_9BACL|nr:fructose PTS transporter subunit IIA [Anoxybacillus suryakundensis]CUA80819.1 PTS system, fructose subfamily, IIA component [Anoxybacillus suryakundensis]
MTVTQLMTKQLVKLQLDGTTKDEIMEEMIGLIDGAGGLVDREQYKQALYDREREGSTGIGFGIAIPHGKSDAVKHPCLAFGMKHEGVDWDSLDGEKVKLIFMIAVPEQYAGNEHLKILQLLARKLMDETFREQILTVRKVEDVLQLFETFQS